MNFVGSEVDVSTGVVTRASAAAAGLPWSNDSQSHSDDSDDDVHPSVSPPGGAEHLFLSGLEAGQISASALAQQMHRQLRHRRSSDGMGGTATVATEDYATACAGWSSVRSSSSSIGNPDDPFSPFAIAQSEPSKSFDFGHDALAHARDLPYSSSTNSSSPYEERFHDANMSTPSSSSSSSTPKPDAAEKVYDAAKNAWGWGKSVSILSPFLGLAETVATKVVGLAGTDLTSVDGTIQHRLEDLDGKYLNPAIAALVSVLLGTAAKSEEILQPLLQALMKPVHLMIKSKPSEPESDPEVTAAPAAAK